MKTTMQHWITRARKDWLSLVLAATTGSLVIAGVLHAKEDTKSDTKNPPARLKQDKEPFQREAGRNSYAPIIKKIGPSVVNIFTTTKPKRVETPQMPYLDDPFFRRFFGDPFDGQGNSGGLRAPKQHGLGSGVIVTEDGYILTNNHVVEGADEIKVGLNAGKTDYTARVVGKDPKSDIAVLKIDATDLPVAVLGDSDYLEVGDVVLAIGNPFGLGQTVTVGIVSALGRATLGLDYEDFIQTDASINPGNSGGALVDAEGRLVGINTAILSRTGGNQGIGFAVPIGLARSVMESLINDGRVVRGFLGVAIQDVTQDLAQAFKLKETHGALVTEVREKTPAQKAGIENGDVIVEFNRMPVKGSRHLKLTVAQTRPGSKVPIKLLREGKERDLEVEVKELPSTEALAQNEADTDAERDTERLRGVTVGDLDARARRQLEVPRDLQGALVIKVEEDSAAYEAGLRAGDVIREINRKPVQNAEEAVAMTNNAKDKVLLLRVWSRGGSRYLVVEEE